MQIVNQCEAKKRAWETSHIRQWARSRCFRFSSSESDFSVDSNRFFFHWLVRFTYPPNSTGWLSSASNWVVLLVFFNIYFSCIIRISSLASKSYTTENHFKMSSESSYILILRALFLRHTTVKNTQKTSKGTFQASQKKVSTIWETL